MLIDLYNIAMAGTMAVAGVLLSRDYVRFLQSTHCVNAKVKSVQHVFNSPSAESGIKSGYYPVLEYRSDSGPVSFTCIDEQVSNRFHIGDRIKLHVTKSRRSELRNCKTFVLLNVMLTILIAGQIASAAIPQSGLGMIHIIVSSFVVATCLFVIVRFKRDQDESSSMQTIEAHGGTARYWLKEPTAFKHWRSGRQDRGQTARVRFSRAFGACCFIISGGIVVGSVLPVLG